MNEHWHRRTFLAAVGAGAALYACGGSSGPPSGAPQLGDNPLPAGGSMPRRRLGRTGVEVSAIGLGGFHLGQAKDERTSIRMVHMAIDHGLDFMDNCWDYNDGESERRMGKALTGGHRQKVFLMTKLDGHTREVAAKQLEQSLSRLRTDVIDLLQVHEVIRPTDPARVFGPDGAIEAYIAAKKAGKIRFIGFTGHKDPAIHLAMLKAAKDAGFQFDTVQMPLNPMDAHYRSFEKEVLPVLRQDDIGVLGMKAIGGGNLLASGVVTARECIEYALSLPTSVVITGCETEGVLEQALDVAMRFQPLTPAERAGLLARTARHALGGELELFKSTNVFDGTIQNPQWLTSAEV
jgi:predicted aldo/keto reductase-like oxidoreductase